MIWINIISLLLALSFFSTIFTDPGKVPDQLVSFFDILKNNRYKRTSPDESTLQEEGEQAQKYCSICENVKPERCHHCSVCGRCVLNMDHHCPMLNVCVGFFNRKFFLLMLIYAVIFQLTVLLYFFPTVLSNIISIIVKDLLCSRN